MVMTRWKRKKSQKNVNLEREQIKYLERNFLADTSKDGIDHNFSTISRQIYRLAISLHQHKIVKDFSETEIESLLSTVLDEPMRAVLATQKVMEYKDIFEEVAKLERYFIPHPSKLPTTISKTGDIFTLYDAKDFKTNPTYSRMLKKVPPMSGMIEALDVDVAEKWIEFRGSYPYSLLWYAKIASTLLATSKKNSWEIIHHDPADLSVVENLRSLRIFYTEGESMQNSIKVIQDVFGDLGLRLRDPSNQGIWTLLNNHHTILVDQSYFWSLLEGDGGIPLQEQVEEIVGKEYGKLETTTLIFRLYEKAHLISGLLISKQNRFVCRPFHPSLTDGVCAALDFAGIRYDRKETTPNLILIIKS